MTRTTAKASTAPTIPSRVMMLTAKEGIGFGYTKYPGKVTRSRENGDQTKKDSSKMKTFITPRNCVYEALPVFAQCIELMCCCS